MQQFLHRQNRKKLSEHSDPQKSSISKHLSECEHANYILNLTHIFDNLNDTNDSDTDKPDTPLSFHNLIQANTQALHTLKTHEIPNLFPIPWSSLY